MEQMSEFQNQKVNNRDSFGNFKEQDSDAINKI